MKSDTETPVVSLVNDKPKSSKGAKIVAAVACIAAICGVGFGVYEMMQNQPKDNQAPAAETTESETLKLKQVKELVDKYAVFNDHTASQTGSNLFESGMTEDYKFYLSLLKINYSDKVSAAHEDAGLVNGNTADYEYSFTYDDVNEAYHSLFGSDSDVQNRDKMWCNVPFFSSEYNKYITINRCGGVYPHIFAYDVLDYYTEGNKLNVEVAYIHVYSEDEDGEVKNYMALNDGKEEVLLWANYVETVKDKLPKYRLTFTKEDAGYILTSINKM